MGNINDTFFEGYYKIIWKAFIPEQLTVKEIDFLVPYFGLEPGKNVLDLMCGYGRHALALGRMGINVTAVDNLPEYLGEIREAAKAEGLPVKTVTANIPDFDPAETFDLVICMGNSLQFFSPDEMRTVLSIIYKALKPGGHLLINSWSIAEIAVRNFKEKTESRVGDFDFIVESAWKFSPSRMEVKSTIIAPGGDTEEKNSVDYIYSLNEMESMFGEAGLLMKEVYSIPGKKKFTVGEPRAYIIAGKK